MSQSLRILHCLRAPVGGLFRHVCDLAREQAGLGHHIGIVCDASTGSDRAAQALEALSEHCVLGIDRVAMSRQISPKDLRSYDSVAKFAQSNDFDIIHGHGAKGGAFARLAARSLKRKGKPVKVFYTPHGGSLHYGTDSLKGKVFQFLERRLEPMTDGIIFESRFSSEIYGRVLGIPRCDVRIIPNGLTKADFQQVHPSENAADFVFVGELRDLKGVHVLIDALGRINREREVRAVLVGAGPDAERFQEQVESLGLQARVVFPGAMPAQEAFALGKCLVVPSLAESFPYIVLEACAAGLPLIATNVGGIPEIIGDTGIDLIQPDSAQQLCDRMTMFLQSPDMFLQDAVVMRDRVRREFSVEKMTRSVIDFYRSTLLA